MKTLLPSLLAAGLTLAAGAVLAHGQAHGHKHAQGHGAHVHGQARLMLAVDGNTVQISLESPLDNLLGFEHAPRTPREKQAAEAMLARLKAPETLLALSPAAGCKAGPAQVSALPGQDGQDSHGDLEADFSFTCASPPRELEVKLFAAFPRLKRLDVQLATPAGQAAHRLGPGKNRISW